MAGNLRDFTLRFLSAVDRFDLTKPADELETVADSAGAAGDGLTDLDAKARGTDLAAVGRDAETAGRKLEAIDGDAKSAGRSLDTLGADAKSTARKFDGAMDSIARSSQTASKDVRGDLKRAEGGLDDFKSEAGSTGRESAASFTGGFDDVAGAVQETAANAFAGFGPVGAAAGLAAAAGIGVLVSQLQAAQERIAEVRETLTGLGLDAGATELDKVSAALDALRQNGDLTGLVAGLDAAGVSYAEYVDAMVNGGPKVDVIKGKLRELGSSGAGLGQALDGNVRSAQSAYDALDQYRQGAEQATGDVKLTTEATAALAREQELAKAKADALAEAQAAVSQALAGVADATPGLNEAVQDTAQKQADATKSTKDSWQDYADGVKLSAEQVVEVLNEQTEAAENFRDNLLETQKRGDTEFTEWVSKQPAAVAAAYADGTAKQKQAIYDAFRRNVGAQQGAGIAAGLAGAQGGVSDAAAGVHGVARSVLSQKITVPTGVSGPSSAELARVRAGIRQGLSGISVSVNAIAQTALGRSVP